MSSCIYLCSASPLKAQSFYHKFIPFILLHCIDVMLPIYKSYMIIYKKCKMRTYVMMEIFLLYGIVERLRRLQQLKLWLVL